MRNSFSDTKKPAHAVQVLLLRVESCKKVILKFHSVINNSINNFIRKIEKNDMTNQKK